MITNHKLDLKRRIHSALTDNNGSRPDAAQALGISLKELYAAIHHDRDLKLRWATSYQDVAPPSEVVVFERLGLPNQPSEAFIHFPRQPARRHSSDATEAIIEHYERVGMAKGWSRDRFYRLCQLLQATTREVLAVCHYHNRDIPQFRKWLKADHIPPVAALSLQMMEDAYFNAVCGFERAVPLVPLDLIV